MLLIPAENKLSTKNPPYLTIILILLNVWAFFFIQGSDEKHYKTALNTYLNSDLLTFEKQVFEDYSYQNRTDVYDSIYQNPHLPEQYLAILILQDKQFAKHVTGLTNYSSEWKKSRDKVNQELAKTSSYQYAFHPSEPTVFAAFSHMFMHGGIGHLLGNMLFLFLFCYNLELLIGRLKTLACYLVSGLGAVTFFAMTTSDKFIPLVGASGAISGLMGGFAAYYGIKKIRYFYWLFIFFNYIKLPAFLVLTYWLAKEYLSAQNSQDNVAYMAHFGGLVVGAAFVYALKLLNRKISIDSSDTSNDISFSDDSADVSSSIQPSNKHSVSSVSLNNAALLQKAIAAQDDLEFEEAKELLRRLIDLEPSNFDYYQRLYPLAVQEPQTSAYKTLVQNILEQTAIQSSHPTFGKLASQALEDLQQYCGGFQSINVLVLQKYCRKLINDKNSNTSKQMINFLIKHYPEQEGLQDLLLHFSFITDPNSKQKVLTYLANKYSETFAGQEAKRILREG